MDTNAKKASNIRLRDTVRTGLKQFFLMYRIKKKDFQVIVEHLTIEEVEVIRDMFVLMDTDNDGNVTYQELKAGLRKVDSRTQR